MSNKVLLPDLFVEAVLRPVQPSVELPRPGLVVYVFVFCFYGGARFRRKLSARTGGVEVCS